MSNIEIERPTKIYFGGVELPIPVFFPSVSSIKTNLLPVEYVQLLAASGIPQFLVSAYDVVNCPEKEEMANAVNAALGERTVILLDSGNYESFWMNDSSWTKERFHEVLKSHRWPIAFSFDVSCKHEMSSEDCAREIADACSRDRSCGSNCALLPIVHGHAENLPDRCSKVARFLNPLALA